MSAAYLKGPVIVQSSAYKPGCTGKIGYALRTEAKRICLKVGTKYPPYHCPYCRLWHVSKNGIVGGRIALTALLALLWAFPGHAAERGIASTYRGHGRTASGEYLDTTRLTCAHPYLPFGTVLTVETRIRKARCIVNDRGPARWTHRLIDLAPATARALRMRGVERVVVEVAEMPEGRRR